jgi:uncharacterized DUF497 family protein
VHIEFDPAKDAINQRQHGLSLALAERFDWSTARFQPARTVGGETRWQVFAPVDGTLFAAIYTLRGTTVRIISLRHASRKERRRYES